MVPLEHDPRHVVWPLPPVLATVVAVYVYRILLAVAGSLFFVVPWLIWTDIWSYSSATVYGPIVYGIPVEEIEFFIIQASFTSIVYLLTNRHLLHSAHLPTESYPVPYQSAGLIVAFLVFHGFLAGLWLTAKNAEGYYAGLTLVWSFPLILSQWIFSSSHVLSLPVYSAAAPILISTASFFALDVVALHRGTRLPDPKLKFDLQVWPGLDIEEALFYLVMSSIVVLGQIMFDKAYAIITVNPVLSLPPLAVPTPWLLCRALFTSRSKSYSESSADNLREAADSFRSKRPNVFALSALSKGTLRIDFVHLYAFYRASVDLIRDASTYDERNDVIERITTFVERTHRSRPTALSATALDTTGFEKHVPEIMLSSSRASPGTAEEDDFDALPSILTDSLSSLPLDAVPLSLFTSLLHGLRLCVEFRADVPIDRRGDRPIYMSLEDGFLPSYTAPSGAVGARLAEICLHLVLHRSCATVSNKDFNVMSQASSKLGTTLYLSTTRSSDKNRGREDGKEAYTSPLHVLESVATSYPEVYVAGRGLLVGAEVFMQSGTSENMSSFKRERLIWSSLLRTRQYD